MLIFEAEEQLKIIEKHPCSFDRLYTKYFDWVCITLYVKFKIENAVYWTGNSVSKKCFKYSLILDW